MTEEVYPMSHYYLLAKGKYFHMDSWLDELKKIACYYLDKGSVTQKELFAHLMPEIWVCILSADNMEAEFIYLFSCASNFLDHSEKNPNILLKGWWELWSQACVTLLMRSIIPNLGEPDGRILPIAQDQTLI